MKRLLKFNDFVNENFIDFSVLDELNERIVAEDKLKKAARLITSLLNKKTNFKFKMVDQVINFKAGTYTPADVQGVMIYSDTQIGNSVLVMGPMGNHPGLVGGLSFFSDYAKPVADFTLTSEQFGIVDLIGEFVNLLDKNYLDEVTGLMESAQIDEGRAAIKFDGKTLKEIKRN